MDNCCTDSHHFPSDTLKSESCNDKQQQSIIGGRFSGLRSSTQNSSHELDKIRLMKRKSDLSFLPLKLEIFEEDKTASYKAKNDGTSPPNGMYRCQPCGIIFSNPCTLEAHQQYYCSHRCETEPQNYVTNEQKSNSSEDMDINENNEKVPKTTSFIVAGESQKNFQRTHRTYYCSQCSYKSNKKISINRHMRMHSCIVKNLLNSAENSAVGGSFVLNNYCPKCNVHFNSYDNFQRHLEYYCRLHCNEENKLSSSHLFVSIPSSPPLVIPYNLLKKSVLISSTMLPPACNVLNSDGNFYFSSSRQTLNEDAKEHHPESRTSPNVNGPLDLSLKNAFDAGESRYCFPGDATMKDVEIKADIGFPSPIMSASKFDEVKKTEAFSAATVKDESSFSQSLTEKDTPVNPDSVQYSPSTISYIDNVSICLRKFDNRSHQKDDKFTAAPRYAQSNDSAPAQTEQSAAEENCYCKECNIVFHQHENYVVHKKHYCSNKMSPGAMKINVNEAPTTLKKENLVANVNRTSQASFFECSTCRIKFQSLENLRAHQSYYCFQHQKLVNADAQHCPNCRWSIPNGWKCSLNVDSPSNFQLKCPECDFALNYVDALPKQKESSSSSQSFQCKICGYKGNTLRGMRTHIRIHFENKLPNAKEESCVVSVQPRDPNLGVTAIIKSLNHSEQAEEQDSFKTYRCDLCNYSSIYKGNVLRHQKCVHFATDKPDDGKFPRALDDKVMKNSFHVNIANFLVHSNHHPLDVMKTEKLIDSSVLKTVRSSQLKKYTLDVAT